VVFLISLILSLFAEKVLWKIELRRVNVMLLVVWDRRIVVRIIHPH